MEPHVPSIIDKLGGRQAVAELVGAKPNAVRAWDRIGVPYRFWAPLLARAGELGVDGLTLEVLQATKPSARAA